MGEKEKTQEFIYQSFLRRLEYCYHCTPINVEFQCGECCKETQQSELAMVGRDFIELVGKCKPLIINMFLEGVGAICEQEASRILIPANRICAVEKPELICPPQIKEEETAETLDIGKEGIRERIECFWQDKIVAVEYECGPCCKKAEYGKLKFVGLDFIEIVEVCKVPLNVIAYLAGVGKVKEVPVEKVIIPLDKICSIQTLQHKCCEE